MSIPDPFTDEETDENDGSDDDDEFFGFEESGVRFISLGELIDDVLAEIDAKMASNREQEETAP